jgi:hypothetical protein
VFAASGRALYFPRIVVFKQERRSKKLYGTPF